MMGETLESLLNEALNLTVRGRKLSDARAALSKLSE